MGLAQAAVVEALLARLQPSWARMPTDSLLLVAGHSWTLAAASGESAFMAAAARTVPRPKEATEVAAMVAAVVAMAVVEGPLPVSTPVVAD